MTTSLDPALLQRILGSGAYGGTDLQGNYNSPSGHEGSGLYTGSNGGGYYFDPSTNQIAEVGQGTNRNVYDKSGQFLNAGQDSGPTEDMMLAMLIASGVGGAYAGGAFGGAGAGGLSGMDIAADAGAGSVGGGASWGGTAAAGGGTAGTTAAGSSWKPFGLGGGSASSGGGMWENLLSQGLGAALNYAMRPDTPDYNAIAQQQGNQNLQAALLQTALNRPDVTGPYGSQTWSTVADPNSPGGFRSSTEIKLSPEQQRLYDQDIALRTGQGQAGQTLLDQFRANTSSPFDLGAYGPQSHMGQTSRLYDPDGGVHFEQVRQQLGQGPSFQGYGAGPGYDRATGSSQYGAFELGPMGGPQMGRVGTQGPAARDLYGQQGYEGSRTQVQDAYQRRMERLRGSQMEADTAALDSKLKNMGLTEGTEAYDRELRNLRQSQNTERSDWADRAILAGGQEQSRLAGLDLAADAQGFGQRQTGYQDMLQAFGFNNNAGQMEFGNILAGLAQRNAARQAGGASSLAETQANNTWARQGMEDTRTAVDQGNNIAQKGFENQRTTAGFNNDAYNQEWQRYMQALQTDQQLRSGRSAEDNTLRSQAIAEGLQARGLPLTEFNALRGGYSAQVPQTQTGPAGQITPTNVTGAAQSQYGANLNNYNANTALLQQIINGMGGMKWGSGGGAYSMGQPGGYTPEELSYFYG